MFGFLKKRRQSYKVMEGLEYIFIKRETEQNSFLISPPKLINHYLNSYIWDYIVVDVIYELLKGLPFIAQIHFEQYWELLRDIKGYQVCNIKNENNSVYTKVLFANGGVKKDLLVEMIKGMDIWSYDGVLKLYGIGSEIYLENSFDTTMLDNFEVMIEPCDDGNNLLIRTNESFITTQRLYQKITDVLSLYGIKLKGELF